MDPPRRTASPGTPARAEAAPAQAKPSPARPSNPALVAHGGASGFEAGGTVGTRGVGAAGGDRFTAEVGASGSAKLGGTAATAGASAVGPVDQKQLDKLFDKGAKVYEGILKSLGVTNLPQIDDPAQRVISRSTALSDLISKDPSLISKISPGDLAQVQVLQKAYNEVLPHVSGTNEEAVRSFLFTAAALVGDYPPFD